VLSNVISNFSLSFLALHFAGCPGHIQERYRRRLGFQQSEAHPGRSGVGCPMVKKCHLVGEFQTNLDDSYFP
jgi:hypothetical protein